MSIRIGLHPLDEIHHDFPRLQINRLDKRADIGHQILPFAPDDEHITRRHGEDLADRADDGAVLRLGREADEVGDEDRALGQLQPVPVDADRLACLLYTSDAAEKRIV